MYITKEQSTFLPAAKTRPSSHVGMGGTSLTFLLGVGGSDLAGLFGVFGCSLGCSFGFSSSAFGARSFSSPSAGCGSPE